MKLRNNENITTETIGKICKGLGCEADDIMEFVGGKVESGETEEQVLIRECQEELAITLSVGDVFMDVVHQYPDIIVHLTLFNATIAEGIPQKLEHNDIKWIKVSEIDEYVFCPADTEILKKLKSEKA
jgi:8-oxo-dGTP diphosphatase